MPEVYFRVQWPNGTTENCYSPSTVIEQYLSAGSDYGVDDFLERVSRALQTASERVQAKFGLACSSAGDQLTAIRQTVNGLSMHERLGTVRVLNIERGGSREARAPNTRRHYPVLIIGAGQAGLSVSYYLKERGIEHVVLDQNEAFSAWSEARWDTFCLVTPNWQCQLPGYPYRGDDPEGFMIKHEILEYLEGFRASFSPPIREHTTVVRVRRASQRERGRFVITTSDGELFADQVVVATGGYHHPRIPDFANELPIHIQQIHSAKYMNPQGLPEGAVLVVGTGQSGCQIAEDLKLAGRKVHLSVGSAPRCARRYRGRDVVEWLERMGYYDIPFDQCPDRDQVRDKTNHYVTGRDGGHDLDLRQFALEGMHLYGSLRGISQGTLHFAPDLRTNLDDADDTYNRINRSIDAFIARQGFEAPPPSEYLPVWSPEAEIANLCCDAEGIRSVVWCTGFEPDYAWLEVPVFRERGHPVHERGVTAVEGMYFIGLPWLYTWGSGRFAAIARDSRYLVTELEAVERRSAKYQVAEVQH
jgi:putative flavoprotein involved in K+ transport